MNYRTSIKIRRALVFIVVFICIIIGAKYDTFYAMIAAMSASAILFTDTCGSCGLIMFNMQGRGWKSYFNPFYVPEKCPRCNGILDHRLELR